MSTTKLPKFCFLYILGTCAFGPVTQTRGREIDDPKATYHKRITLPVRLGEACVMAVARCRGHSPTQPEKQQHTRTWKSKASRIGVVSQDLDLMIEDFIRVYSSMEIRLGLMG